jgi:SAM-dependent methyltransferase
MTTMARDKSFDRVAREYDAARPGYPDAMYDRILGFASLEPTTRVLEVGVGTGKATLPLARRGFEIHGLEPGANLSAIARTNLAPFPRVTIATTTFEAWTIEREVFGLAFSAQAFHWLDPKLRLERFAKALHAGGVLAVFGNVADVPAGLLRNELDAAYEALAPSLSSAGNARSWYGTADSPVMAELAASPHFLDVEFNNFEWQRTLDAPSYCRLLSSHSDHSTLPPAQLAVLLARVAELVDSHGGVTLSYTTGLFLARRSKSRLGKRSKGPDDSEPA